MVENGPISLVRPGTSDGIARDRLATGLLFLACLILTRHPQFPSLSGLAGPSVFLVVILLVHYSARLYRLTFYALFLLGSMLLGMWTGANIGDSLRFFAILMGTLIVFESRNFIGNLPFIMAPIALQCLVISAISLYLGIAHDIHIARAFRVFALSSAWGDIYSMNGMFYCVQVVGNALIPLFFMVSFHLRKQHRVYRVYTIVGALGVIAAANMTYLIALFLYLAIRFIRGEALSPKRKLMLAIFVVLAFIAVGAKPFLDSLALKTGSQSSSLGHRLDQVDTLWGAYGNNPILLVFGHGLGARFPDSASSNYSQALYLEVQTLYFLYQIGLLGMIFYFFEIAKLVKQRLTKEGATIFLFYILCGLSNPYILDSSQMVASLILIAGFPKGRALASGASEASS